MIAQSFDFQVLPLRHDMLLRLLKSLHSSSPRFAQANGMSPESPRMIAFPAMRRDIDDERAWMDFFGLIESAEIAERVSQLADK